MCGWGPSEWAVVLVMALVPLGQAAYPRCSAPYWKFQPSRMTVPP